MCSLCRLSTTNTAVGQQYYRRKLKPDFQQTQRMNYTPFLSSRFGYCGVKKVCNGLALRDLCWMVSYHALVRHRTGSQPRSWYEYFTALHIVCAQKSTSALAYTNYLWLVCWRRMDIFNTKCHDAVCDINSNDLDCSKWSCLCTQSMRQIALNNNKNLYSPCNSRPSSEQSFWRTSWSSVIKVIIAHFPYSTSAAVKELKSGQYMAKLQQKCNVSLFCWHNYRL